MKNTEKTIDLLNTLVEINNDRTEGYTKALQETTEADLKTIFTKFIKTSQKCLNELSKEILTLGGQPTDSTKTSGKFFRVWMDVKAALTSKDRHAILSSCEFGEDYATGAYKKALKDHAEIVSATQLSMIEAQYQAIKAEHDTVKSMRDALVEHKV